jgi:hypothetical protein
MPLSDTAIRQAKPKNYKLADAKGLYLLIQSNGARYWRCKYRFAGKEKLLALGLYPEVSLKEARLAVDAARSHLRNGVDPSELRKLRKNFLRDAAANSFESIALEWYQPSVAIPLHGYGR